MAEKAKEILIAGYFGFNNLGDELILESIISSLIKEIPGARITFLSENPSQTPADSDRKAINRWNPLEILAAIFKCDILLSAGGLYQDATGMFSLYYYLALIVIAKIFRKKVVLFGVDFVPIQRRINRLMVKIIVPLADSINVRTEGSLAFLKELNITKNVELTADAVLLIDGSHTVKGDKEKINKIGIILKKSDNIRNYVELCNALAGRFEAEILFIPFHLQRDFIFSKQIADKMNLPSRIIRWKKPYDIFAISGEVDFIVSQRLHGLIIGTMLGIPILSISNDQKLEFFSKEIGQKFLHLRDMDVEVVTGIVSDIWQWRGEFKKLASNNLPKLKYRSYLNVKKVKELIT